MIYNKVMNWQGGVPNLILKEVTGNSWKWVEFAWFSTMLEEGRNRINIFKLELRIRPSASKKKDLLMCSKLSSRLWRIHLQEELPQTVSIERKQISCGDVMPNLICVCCRANFSFSLLILSKLSTSLQEVAAVSKWHFASWAWKKLTITAICT